MCDDFGGSQARGRNVDEAPLDRSNLQLRFYAERVAPASYPICNELSFGRENYSKVM